MEAISAPLFSLNGKKAGRELHELTQIPFAKISGIHVKKNSVFIRVHPWFEMHGFDLIRFAAGKGGKIRAENGGFGVLSGAGIR